MTVRHHFLVLYFSNLIGILAQTAFASSYTEGKVVTTENKVAYEICNTASQDHRDALIELKDIKYYRLKGFGPGHPNVFVSDVNKLVEIMNPSFNLRSIAEELKTMEVWSEDEKLPLFAA